MGLLMAQISEKCKNTLFYIIKYIRIIDYQTPGGNKINRKRVGDDLPWSVLKPPHPQTA
jgi:hypothetical protein